MLHQSPYTNVSGIGAWWCINSILLTEQNWVHAGCLSKLCDSLRFVICAESREEVYINGGL